MGTPQQDKKWKSFKRQGRSVNLLVKATYLSVQNALAQQAFAKEHELELSAFSPLHQKTKSLVKIDRALQNIITDVELELLGLRFTNGDFDILAPQGITGDALARYQPTSLGWIPLVVGVVVVAGAVGWIAWLRMENETLVDDYNELLEETDNKFCADPNSDICQTWLQRKIEVAYEERESTIDKIAREAAELGKTLKTGAHWGLVIGIPLVLWALFARKQ